MADELELLTRKFGIRHFSFADDAMTIDRDATIGLCDEIVERRLRVAFDITTRTDCVDRTMLDRLKQAGCYSVAYGIETASQTILKAMNKENEVESARRAIRLAKEAGLSVTALLIVGSVGETDETIDETIRFLQETRPDIVACTGSLWILPGTKLYQDCKRAVFIDDAYWLGDEPYKIYTLEHSLPELRRYVRRIQWKGMDIRRLFVRKVRRTLARLLAPPASLRPSRPGS